MKIFEVEIQNFRQYRGMIKCKISTDQKKNFSILLGDNGGGKSNFMNAIVWCLFEDEMFKSKKNEGRQIANSYAVQELESDKSLEVSVAVYLGESSPEYKIERKTIFIKHKNVASEGLSEFYGYNITRDKGWSRMPDPNWFINKHFIPKDLRSFFFFDGEKMDKYFEDTSSVKTNVEKIAQIDILNDAIATVKSTSREIWGELGKLNLGSSAITDKLDELNDQKEGDDATLVKVKENIIDVGLELKRIEAYLRDNSDKFVSEIQGAMDSLTKRKKDCINLIDETRNRMRDLVCRSIAPVYSLEALKYSKKLIEEETEKGVLPPNVKDVFLRELLDNHMCICGRSLGEGDCGREKVEELLNKLMPSDISSDATDGKFKINDTLKNADFRSEYHSLLKTLNRAEGDLEELNGEIEKKSSILKNYNVEEIRAKEEMRAELSRKNNQLHTRQGTLGNKIINIVQEIATLQEEIKKANKTDRQAEYLTKQKNYAMKLEALLIQVKDTIVTEVRRQLEDKTREYFFNMIWKKNAFSDVQIVDLGAQYRISVKNEYGEECLGDLSAGERQVLALSFTAALYSVSGYSVPVIIDTPLGRISGTTRENIASSLPNYLSQTQVIMTVTDTEYTEPVREAIKPCVGTEYHIRYDEKSKSSQVVEY